MSAAAKRRRDELARMLEEENTPITPTASTSAPSTSNAISTPSNDQPSTGLPVTSEHPDYEKARSDDRIVQLREALAKETGLSSIACAERALNVGTLRVLQEMSSSVTRDFAKSIAVRAVPHNGEFCHSINDMRKVLPVVLENENWEILAMLIWMSNPHRKTLLGQDAVFGASALHTLKSWAGDQTARNIPPFFAPEILLSIWHLHHVMFTRPDSTGTLSTTLLPNNPPMGRFARPSTDTASSSSSSNPLSFEFFTQLNESLTDIPIVELIDNYAQENPGSFAQLLDKKGILSALKISLDSKPEELVVLDLEIKVDVSKDEALGLNNGSIISKDEACNFVKTGEGRYHLSYKKDGNDMIEMDGGFEMVAKAVELMSRGRHLIVYNNSRIDERGIWDALLKAHQLLDLARPRFATRKAVTSFGMINSDGNRSTLKMLNFGGTNQSSQRRLGFNFWNVSQCAAYWYATPSAPTRTTRIAAVDLRYPIEIVNAARRHALEPFTVGKSTGDVLDEFEIANSFVLLALRDLQRVEVNYNKKLPRRIETGSDNDEGSDGEDGDVDEDQGGYLEVSRKSTKGKEKELESETYEIEKAKSRIESWTPEQYRWMLALWSKKYGFDVVADHLAIDRITLKSMIDGLDVSLSGLILFLSRTGYFDGDTQALTPVPLRLTSPSFGDEPFGGSETRGGIDGIKAVDDDDDFESATSEDLDRTLVASGSSPGDQGDVAQVKEEEDDSMEVGGPSLADSDEDLPLHKKQKTCADVSFTDSTFARSLSSRDQEEGLRGELYRVVQEMLPEISHLEIVAILQDPAQWSTMMELANADERTALDFMVGYVLDSFKVV